MIRKKKTKRNCRCNICVCSAQRSRSFRDGHYHSDDGNVLQVYGNEQPEIQSIIGEMIQQFIPFSTLGFLGRLSAFFSSFVSFLLVSSCGLVSLSGVVFFVSVCSHTESRLHDVLLTTLKYGGSSLRSN